MAVRYPLSTALRTLTVATNLSSAVGHPPPSAMRTPGSHTRPSKDRHNLIDIDTAQVETLPCVSERSRPDQRTRSLLDSEADLPRSDRDSPSYSYESLSRKFIIRSRLLLIQLADAHRVEIVKKGRPVRNVRFGSEADIPLDLTSARDVPLRSRVINDPNDRNDGHPAEDKK